MKIFDKRPLSLILCILSGGFCLFYFLSPALKIILVSISTVALLLSFALPKTKTKSLPKIALIVLLISFILSFLYFDTYFYNIQDSEENEEFEGVVYDLTSYEGTEIFYISTAKRGGLAFSKRVAVTIFESTEKIGCGDTVLIYGKLSAYKGNSEVSLERYYTSKGISAKIEAEYINLLNDGTPSLSYYIKEYRQSIAGRAVLLSDEFSGGLLSALLLGEKNMMDDELRLNFKLIGASHILALSGMHLAILMAALNLILSLFKIDKRITVSISAVFCFAFMALVGFPYSIMRAGIMLIICSVLYILSGCKDSVTSLFLSFTVILAIKPYGACDVGLILSVTSTLAILVSAELIGVANEGLPIIKRIYNWAKGAILTSLFAISATMAISAIIFDGASTLGIISTPILGFLAQIYIYIGVCTLVLGSIIPIGAVLSMLSGVIGSIAGTLADLPFSYFSTSFITVQILGLLTTLSFVVFSVAYVKRKRAFTALIASLLFFTYLSGVGMSYGLYNSNTVLYGSEGDNDRFLITSGGKSCLIDISSYYGKDMVDSVSFLSENGVSSLDVYMVVRYTKRLPNTVKELVTDVKISSIAIPEPMNETEKALSLDIVDFAKERSISVDFYSPEKTYIFGFIDVKPLFRTAYDGSGFSFAISLESRGLRTTYISSGAIDDNFFLYEDLMNSDCAILGSHGSEYRNPLYLDEKSERLSTLVINGDSVYVTDELKKHSDSLNIINDVERLVVIR